MSILLTLGAAGWIAAAAVMAVVWAVQRRTRNAGLVDVAWTALVGGLAVLYATQSEAGWVYRRLAIASMMGSWGARLAVHLLYDRVLGKPEEGRYAELRRRKGNRADVWFFWFFQAQAAAAVYFSIPALVAGVNPMTDFAGVELAAVAVWLIAFSGETTADRQLLQFKMNPENQGRTCQAGLWRYSRHPNYFFEWLMWVSYALFATGSRYGWVAWSCPALMLWLLFKVTGIPATEAQALRSRGDGYRAYQQTTSVFVPWPRRG